MGQGLQQIITWIRTHTRHIHAHHAVFALACVALFIGWRTFWFLCDDAFIAFRYVSNSLLGYGYTWNPPPFHPVDGYTSFLWVVILDGVWRLLEVPPPESANWISLLFSVGQLALSTLLVMGLELPQRLRSWRTLFLGLVLAGILSNRTWLAWTSSGLETALFNFCILLWLTIVFRLERHHRLWPLYLAASTTLLVLCRPDGLLFCVPTLLFLALVWWRSPRCHRGPLLWAGAALLIPLSWFFTWKRLTYGAWLPNTYYAKVTSVWPEVGLRYLASFVLEYALWYWAILIGAGIGWFVLRSVRIGQGAALNEATDTSRMSVIVAFGMPRARELRQFPPEDGASDGGGSDGGVSQPRTGLPTMVVGVSQAGRGRLETGAVRCIAIGTVLLHIGYYTLVVGGDHFEYRPYSYLIPLIYVSLLWALGQLRLPRLSTTAVLVGFILLSGVIPWLHWSQTHRLETRNATYMLRHKLAPELPQAIRWYGVWFDNLQHLCISHYVGSRHQEHKVFLQHQMARLPPREAGSKISGEDFPVIVARAVGYLGWVLPRVAVIDSLGLNDYFIARNVEFPEGWTLMGHNRGPPVGYVQAFRANVRRTDDGWKVRSRVRPLTAAEIIRIEKKYQVWANNLD